MTAEQESSPGEADRRRLRLTELAFAPGGDPRIAAEAAAALRELEDEHRREGETTTADPPVSPDAPPTPEPDEPAPDPRARRRRRAPLWIGGALVVLLVAGAAIQGATSATRQATESEPVASDPSSFRTSVLSAALNRAEVPTDALPEAIRGEVNLGSSRVVYDEDPSLAATADRWRLWVGYGVDTNQVCFVATYDNVGDAVTCVPKERALLDRVVLVSTLPGRRFEMLTNGGAIAVQID